MVRIVDRTPDETVIEDVPWGLGLCLVFWICLGTFGVIDGLSKRDIAQAGICAILTGGALVWLRFGVRRVRLTLGRESARLTVRDAAGTHSRQFPRNRLRADLARDSDGGTTRAILVLDGPGGEERVPLTAYLSSGPGHERAVDRINAWAASA